MTRTCTTLLGVAFGLLVAASNASAFTTSADCAGWTVTTNFSDTPATLTASTQLFKLENGAYVPVAGGSTQVQSLAAPGQFVITSGWTVQLANAAGYQVRYHLVITTPANTLAGDFTDTFSGECVVTPPPSGGSPRTPGYWKNHAEVWPVSTLSVGGDPYSKQCLLAFLGLPTVGDARVKLIHHLVSAKLNILANPGQPAGNVSPSTPTGYPNPNSTIRDTIDAGDAFLASNGTEINCATNSLTGRAPSGGQKTLANAIKDALDAFNNLTGG